MEAQNQGPVRARSRGPKPKRSAESLGISRDIDPALFAQDTFEIEEFRPLQEDIIAAELSGEVVLATLPTGGGKSLCYQLPAVMRSGLTIVISPLVALIRDQVHSLQKLGIPVAQLHGQLSDEERMENYALARSGSAKLLYLAPERFRSPLFFEELGDVKVSHLVVDEAHCISMWGHDFRPSYLLIPEARRRLGNPSMSIYTATAPVIIRDDIKEVLELKSPVEIHADVDRPNLEFSRKLLRSEEAKVDYLLAEVARRAKKGQNVLIYCSKITSAESLCEKLRDRKLPAAFYHAQMEQDERKKTEAQFRDGVIKIMCATKAFGMGVDKPDIDAVFHFQPSGALEEYYQEAGRCARDGRDGFCQLLYTKTDIHLLNSRVNGQNPDLSFIKATFRRLWSMLKDKSPEKRYLHEKGFVEGWTQSTDNFRQAQIRASLAIMEENELIKRNGNIVEFIYTPANSDLDDFPLSEQLLSAKKLRDLQRLKIMLYYITAADEDEREMILGHFNQNSIVNDIGEIDVEGLLAPSDEEVLKVLRPLVLEDQARSSYPGILAGSSKTSKSMEAFAGTLDELSPIEVGLVLDNVVSAGLIRVVPVGKRSFLTLTPAGMDKLEEDGVKLQPSESWDKLKKRMLNPVDTTLVRAAVRSWFNGEKNFCVSSDEWWESIKRFRDEDFTVLGKKVTGEQLAAAFSRTRRGSLQLKEIKQFLNFLFQNQIP